MRKNVEAGAMTKYRWYTTSTAVLLIVLIGSMASCTSIVITGKKTPVEEPVSPPIINSFTASPTNLTQEQRTTLSWNVSGATEITIQPAIGTVGPSGSLLLTPTASITYILTASNQGGSNTSSVTITVTPAAVGQPDLVITDIWLVGSEVSYKIANRGNAEAKPTQSYLYVNGLKKAADRVDPLAAGEERTTSFSNFDWIFPGAAGDPGAAIAQFNVKACADAENTAGEDNEDNNCLTKIWGQTFNYDFVQNAHLAEWRSGAAIITWPKFAGNQQGAAYVDGTVLIMCPEQVSNGWIQGRFADFYYNPSTKTTRSSLLEVPQNAKFMAEVGFKPGSTSTDGAGIALGYLDEAGGAVLFPKMDLSPGAESRVYTVDLSYLAGKKTEFVLRVEAKNSPEGDCVRWVKPRIVQE
jgi:hypothetical protein